MEMVSKLEKKKTVVNHCAKSVYFVAQQLHQEINLTLNSDYAVRQIRLLTLLFTTVLSCSNFEIKSIHLNSEARRLYHTIIDYDNKLLEVRTRDLFKQKTVN